MIEKGYRLISKDVPFRVSEIKSELKSVMQELGRKSRGRGKVFVKEVREAERKLLSIGKKTKTLALLICAQVLEDENRPESKREKFRIEIHQALENYSEIEKQSRLLTGGKKLSRAKITNAHDPTLTAICKGKSNTPAQFGRKPGIVAEMATGFTFAFALPEGNPGDNSYAIPLLEGAQSAIDSSQKSANLQIKSLAGDLGLNDSKLRDELHNGKILSVGIPRSVTPIESEPSEETIQQVLLACELFEYRTPAEVRIAYQCGYSRPLIESVIQELISPVHQRFTYRGRLGATRQMGMLILAKNARTLVRISQGKLSERAQGLRKKLGLERREARLQAA